MIGCSCCRPLLKLASHSLELIKPPVLKVQRLIVNPAGRWSNPIRKLARFHDAPTHERLDVRIIFRTRHPLGLVVFPRLFAQNFTFRADEMPGEIAERAMKALVWQGQPEGNACVVDYALPAANPIGYLLDVIIA